MLYYVVFISLFSLHLFHPIACNAHPHSASLLAPPSVSPVEYKLYPNTLYHLAIANASVTYAESSLANTGQALQSVVVGSLLQEPNPIMWIANSSVSVTGREELFKGLTVSYWDGQ
jgi:hypothetical protein